MKINEIFESIQGEGQMTGYPCVFIRLYGCNFNCRWCDTLYSREPSKDFKEMTVGQVIEEVKKFKSKYICITGGEPLFQKKEVKKLVDKLIKLGYFCEINTNGSLAIWKQRGLRWAVDSKMPSSGMFGRFYYENLKYLGSGDDIIMVVKNKKDYSVASSEIKEIRKRNRKVKMVLSPCWGDINKRELVRWLLEDGLDARIGLQIHKIIWPKNRRAV
jgi:7-carboxy-7-deazaguanine synthase